MSLRPLLLAVLALAGVNGAAVCTPEIRLGAGQAVIDAYAQTAPGASAAAFNQIPYGVGGLDGKCIETFLVDSLPPVLTGLTGHDCANFGTETRQLISKFVGYPTDFPQNNSMVIKNTNVTFGVRDIIPIPVTFNADIYMDFSPAPDCRIKAVRGYANFPTEVLGKMIDSPSFPPILTNIFGTDNIINDLLGDPVRPSKRQE